MAKKETQSAESTEVTSFGERLAAAMKLAGETKSSLARKSGLSEAAIRGYLKGDSSPSIVQLMKLAKATGINAAWFLGEDDGSAGVVSIEDDIALLTMLFRHLSGAQRRLAMAQVLSVLSSQFADVNAEEFKALTPSVIDTALKINSLSTEQRRNLQAEFDITLSPKG
ncbi:TPA: helix-turn-helix domain-containing protein [Klebsiella quasipneumoniae subsp. quasipneumoniae]|nr:helix-turn-helix domain-containing protein [Klebsiella quasipneumoniae subsp. similipneumoniae]HBR1460311.1 helix-turn-helix domain-containing protein [Klebsiella quasipneumoniae subsp. quasipneumoniae]HBR2034420.1 helix-turn-helix domain-containing protein [Klebsiella quasipneumoniae subsp. quasipneumoniae]HCI6432426.1 helix-turn-helix domain-containing protein [Klebsiella quasipneumoniae subsp. similipneumoniae]